MGSFGVGIFGRLIALLGEVVEFEKINLRLKASDEDLSVCFAKLKHFWVEIISPRII